MCQWDGHSNNDELSNQILMSNNKNNAIIAWCWFHILGTYLVCTPNMQRHLSHMSWDSCLRICFNPQTITAQEISSYHDCV